MKVYKSVSLSIGSRLDCVSLIAVSIHALCRDHGMDDVSSYQVQTVVTEAINNAIIHAYEGRDDQSVRVNWTLDDETIRIEVCDDGKSMAQLPPHIEPPPDAESGRGWWIMRNWTDRIEYETINGQNLVVMWKKI